MANTNATAPPSPSAVAAGANPTGGRSGGRDGPPPCDAMACCGIFTMISLIIAPTFIAGFYISKAVSSHAGHRHAEQPEFTIDSLPIIIHRDEHRDSSFDMAIGIDTKWCSNYLYLDEGRYTVSYAGFAVGEGSISGLILPPKVRTTVAAAGQVVAVAAVRNVLMEEVENVGELRVDMKVRVADKPLEGAKEARKEKPAAWFKLRCAARMDMRRVTDDGGAVLLHASASCVQSFVLMDERKEQ